MNTVIDKLEKYRKRQARIIDRLAKRPSGTIRPTPGTVQMGTPEKPQTKPAREILQQILNQE